MREIKFRAWDKIIKRMLYFDFTQHIDPTDCEIMQFTGLKDTNGKEIYEGDILGGTFGDGYIGYCDKCKSFEYLFADGECTSCNGDISWFEMVEENGKLEVIGNIYENPELLVSK